MAKQQHKILLVDDEQDILEFLSYNLKKNGYLVYTANNGRDAIKLARKLQPHIIVLDIMMPEMDGIETCGAIRQDPLLKDSVIAMLTARTKDYSQIAGFQAGADDYIKKPIRPKVFVSKINALLRRVSSFESNTKTLLFDNLTIEKDKYQISKDGKSATLPKKEFELLSLLTSKPNKVFSREEIYSQVWGDHVFVGDRTIDVHITRLREKIGTERIKTYKGVGYSFVF